jgi:uroporphyrinogen decarboxylase
MGEKITSRQRVRMALDHKEADRIPIDFGAMRSTGIATIAYNKLRKKLGINKGLARMYDITQALAYPEKEVRDRFHIDCIDPGQVFLKDESQWKEFTLNDGSRCLIPKYIEFEIDKEGTLLLRNSKGLVVGKKPRSSYYVDQVYWPFADLPSIPEEISDKKLADFLWAVPSPPWHLNIYDDDQFQTFVKSIKDLHQNTDYSIMLAVGCNLFEAGTWLRGMDIFMMDYMTDRKGTERLLDKLMERYFKLLDRVIQGVGEYVDLFQFGDDLGSQGGVFIPPDIFKDIFYPRYKKMWDFVHDKSDIKIFLHSCGSIFELIPYLIDAGLDALNPVQTTSANMEPEKLKKEFGTDITFWGGGSNTRDVLPYKSPAEVAEDVKRRVEVFSKGGGFVFNQIHNVMVDVPPENVIAMFDAAYEFGKY